MNPRTLLLPVLLAFSPVPAIAQVLSPGAGMSPGSRPAREVEPAVVGLAQVAAGAGAGLLLGVPLYAYLEKHAGDRRVEGDAAYSPTANATLIASTAVGTALGVYLVGEWMGRDGSLGGTLLGSAIGALPLLLAVDDPYLVYWTVTLGLGLESLGAMIGF